MFGVIWERARQNIGGEKFYLFNITYRYRYIVVHILMNLNMDSVNYVRQNTTGY